MEPKSKAPSGSRKSCSSAKPQFLRHLTSKLMGYALGRGLTAGDACTVDRIVDQLESQEYRSQALIREIVLSVPFRYRTGTIANKAVQEGIR